MYDIKQFRPVLYFVLAMGLVGFSLSVELPALCIFSLLVLIVHYWLVTTNRFRPIPRIVANIVTLGTLLYTFQAVRTQPTPIITIGQFLVLLQMIKLFELRANRDYTQLLVLSLLLMVAGAISTAGLAFAVLFVVYLFVALYCCLLFHLKIENDAALIAQSPPLRPGEAAPHIIAPNAATVRQDQRFLARSMKKLAALVAFVALATSVVVFLFFPRGAGAGMFGQVQLRAGQALTGFSDDVSFGSISRIQQNSETVANVQVIREDGSYVDGSRVLYLRGKTFDRYNRTIRKWDRAPLYSQGDSRPEGRPWRGESRTQSERNTSANSTTDLMRSTDMPTAGEKINLHIALRPTASRTLFVPANPVRIVPGRDLGKIHYARFDHAITLNSELFQRLDYDIEARLLSSDDDLITSTAFPNPPPAQIASSPAIPEDNKNPDAVLINPRIAEYARRTEVSGDAQDPNLAAKRPAAEAAELDHQRKLNPFNPPSGPVPTDIDQRIAENIQRHLLTQFRYTLDLPGTVTVDPNRDPIEQFLYDWKVGHCEYFASSMTLLCQSVGLQARMVTGFKCDEYDKSMGNYYIVRQSHAHAWVEVKTPEGWRRFDPTSGNEVTAPTERSTWGAIKHFFAFLDYKWATSVVAYDADRRDSLVSNIDRKLINTVVNSGLNPNSISRTISDWWNRQVNGVNRWLDGRGGWSLADSIRMLVAVAVIIAFVLYARRALRRLRMRRRAARIGLESLPASQQFRLAMQLGFYDRLMKILERHRVIRPAHLTPQEFSHSLTFLPAEAFDAVKLLTQAFYDIRFGQQPLPHEKQKELESTVDKLEPILGNAVPIR